MKNNNPTIVIAEVGVNHNGDIELARRLVDAAKSSGADYVKFQTFKTEGLVSRKASKAAYQTKNTGDAQSSQFEMLQKLELTDEQFVSLKKYCDEVQTGFLSTAFDVESIDFVNTLNPDYLKIPSGELTNLPYLRRIGSLNKSVLLSTGMADLREVEEALDVLQQAGCGRNSITVLQCTSAYPAPIEEVNLKAMQSMEETFKIKVGYSDHTSGIAVPLAAVAMGAAVIEKHLTLDQSMQGPDHQASLEAEAFKEMVKGIREIEQAMGSGKKSPGKTEEKNRAVVRKSIHLANDLEEGAVISEADLQMLRPGDGITPMKIEKVTGAVTSKPLIKGHKLAWADIV